MVLLRMPRIKRYGHSLSGQLSVIQKRKIAKPHILKEWTYFFLMIKCVIPALSHKLTALSIHIVERDLGQREPVPRTSVFLPSFMCL